MPSVFLGIDPGQDGGIVAIHKKGIIVRPMPATESDVCDLIERLGHMGEEQEGIVALIEKVHAMPGNGVVSMFKFARGTGVLMGALLSSKIRFEEVTPQKWQGGLAIPSRKVGESQTEWKNRLKGIAQKMFPDVSITSKTADAILIAEYCRRTRS